MLSNLKQSSWYKNIDWLLVVFLIPILSAGLMTMSSFSGDSSFFTRQIIWVVASFVLFFGLSIVDFRFLRRGSLLLGFYGLFVLLLVLLFVFGLTANGATSWFNLGAFSFQPADFMKLALILVLAKYFSRRHVEIKNFKHLVVTAIYMLIPFVLIFLQPDFGSAIIIFLIWLGMTFVSGISRKHLMIVFGIGFLAFGAMWGFVFEDYQKARVMTFINPLSDIQGTGYNAYQSTIAVGSGQFLGKGVGYGTQSRLEFLPEYETDFIFAAFAEEWGFVGAMIILLFYVLVVWRILRMAKYGSSNFEILFGLGVAIMFIAHIIINVGMNIALMPVTGITLPFMSYGGSHLLTSFISVGILMGMYRYRRTLHREDAKNEFLGI